MLNIALNALQWFFSQLWLLIVLFAAFVLLNVLDGHSTWMVLRPDHYRRERNPVARWIFRKFGLPRGIVIFKFVLLLVLGALFAFYAASDTFTLNIVLLVADIVFLVVVLHNYKVYRRMAPRRPLE
ncbi:MAG TPA: DUF5658 family protein [Candidatus Syntrophosphaera sp.]|jgi:purine-cytosine permease-like protein|nr:DUF5658 family protein [Candidatus Syntrophosphaera sp.]